MSETASAGWYPDPDSANILRWWDGAAWTEARQPIPARQGDRVSDGVGLLLLAFLGLLALALVWYFAATGH